MTVIIRSYSASQRGRGYVPNEFDLARTERAEQKRRRKQLKAPTDTIGPISDIKSLQTI